jgi:hypothetical protein
LGEEGETLVIENLRGSRHAVNHPDGVILPVVTEPRGNWFRITRAAWLTAIVRKRV